MQQLDFWFSRYPKGFYKLLEPADHSHYRCGQNWLEEIGFSIAEFRTAFDRVGIRYTSKTAFYAEDDPFQGKFYASYFDRNLRLTIYYRNHKVVDEVLDRMQRENPDDWFPAEDFDCSAPEPEPDLLAHLGSPASPGKARAAAARHGGKSVSAARSVVPKSAARDAESESPRDVTSTGGEMQN